MTFSKFRHHRDITDTVCACALKKLCNNLVMPRVPYEERNCKTFTKGVMT